MIVPAVSAPVISAAVRLGCPDLLAYRGLSGIDSALFGFVAAMVFRRAWADDDRRTLAVVTAAAGLFCAKVALECAAGTTLFVDSLHAGFAGVPLAHATGLLVDGLVALELPHYPAGRASVQSGPSSDAGLQPRAAP